MCLAEVVHVILIQVPLGHQTLRYDGFYALVKGCSLECYPSAIEKAPCGYPVRVHPALILQELFPIH
jgi:hypothetical protein